MAYPVIITKENRGKIFCRHNVADSSRCSGTDCAAFVIITEGRKNSHDYEGYCGVEHGWEAGHALEWKLKEERGENKQ